MFFLEFRFNHRDALLAIGLVVRHGWVALIITAAVRLTGQNVACVVLLFVDEPGRKVSAGSRRKR